MDETKNNHIQLAINFCDLIRSTLGPRGMNKAVVQGTNAIFTNDGSTIVNSINAKDPIIQLFKDLAKSQEEAIGDGTTTSVILAGQLLNNALQLMNKGIHPTTIINGYSLAKVESMRYLDEHCEKGDKEKIIKTAFGSKVSKDIITHLTKVILGIKNYEELKTYKVINADPLESKIFKGHVFEGFTINDRTPKKIEGKIALLDYRTNVDATDFKVSQVDELKKINEYDRTYKKDIIDKLAACNVNLLFYTDTNPEFEAYLTEKGITGIVVYKREEIDGITQALDLKATSDPNNIFVKEGVVEYEKPETIYVKGQTETLILKGSTQQVLDEIERAVHDVISLFKHDTQVVIGAGAIEIELAKQINHFAKTVGGKEQLAIEKYAEALESIPLILAENCGHDAIQILTILKTIHEENKDIGVDMVSGVSDARERGILDPVLVKIHAINSATNVANLILKTDKLLLGENESSDNGD